MSMTGRVSRRSLPLTPRGIRVRNACVQHAASQLGLDVPGSEELRALPDDAGLREAVEWWQRKTPGVVAAPVQRRSQVLLRVAVVSAVTLLGLALSYRPVQ
jgi:hypothetical protein